MTSLYLSMRKRVCSQVSPVCLPSSAEGSVLSQSSPISQKQRHTWSRGTFTVSFTCCGVKSYTVHFMPHAAKVTLSIGHVKLFCVMSQLTSGQLLRYHVDILQTPTHLDVLDTSTRPIKLPLLILLFSKYMLAKLGCFCMSNEGR